MNNRCLEHNIYKYNGVIFIWPYNISRLFYIFYLIDSGMCLDRTYVSFLFTLTWLTRGLTWLLSGGFFFGARNLASIDFAGRGFFLFCIRRLFCSVHGFTFYGLSTWYYTRNLPCLFLPLVGSNSQTHVVYIWYHTVGLTWPKKYVLSLLSSWEKNKKDDDISRQV